MLRVTIECLPSDSTKQREVLATLDICNVNGTAEVADYTVALTRKGTDRVITGLVPKHYRFKGYLPLVTRAFREMWGD